MTGLLKPLLCVAVLAALPGCRHDASAAHSPFAGSYSGSWVAVDDSTDYGASAWTVDSAGIVSGTDDDPGAGSTAHIAGTIDSTGRLSTIATPAGRSSGDAMGGKLSFDARQRLGGILRWSGKPPTSYRYTLTRR